MEAVLSCKPEDLEDYYGLLGCDELSTVGSGEWEGYDYLLEGNCVKSVITHVLNKADSDMTNMEDNTEEQVNVNSDLSDFTPRKRNEPQTEQIINEYKIRALACHPDKHLDNPTAVADFQKLQEAKEVLCNETKRKNYDLWRRSGVAIPFHDWQALNDSVKTSMHWAVRNKKEPMLEASKPETQDASPAEDQDHGDHEEAMTPSTDATPPSSEYYHLRFRWAADSPSNLLRKFRNYEI